MVAHLDIKLLATFVRAAHSGTLSTTAVQVGRTQSTITMQIKRLEDALGGQSLFHRSGRGVRLTGHGERFLTYAERILKIHDEAVSAISGKGLRGSIIFGSPEDYLIAFFPTILKTFGTLHPDVEIKVVSAPTVELHSLLHARQVDLALVSVSDPKAREVVRTEPLVWVGSKPTLHRHEFGDTVPLALPASNAVDHKAARDAMARARLRYKITHASNSLAGLIAVTRSGLAISVMTKEAVPPDLFILKAPLPRLSNLGVLIAFADTTRAPAVEAFASHIRRILPSL